MIYFNISRAPKHSDGSGNEEEGDEEDDEDNESVMTIDGVDGGYVYLISVLT